MPLSVTIVTAQRTILEQDGVTKIVVPTEEGQITILPHHAALMTSLGVGEMVVTWPGGQEFLAIHGGFLQVQHDVVSVLADAAETASAIDLERAEAARARAEARLAGREPVMGVFDVLRAQVSLQRALTRSRVARRRSATGATGVPSQRP